jgi:hypothetical protein
MEPFSPENAQPRTEHWISPSVAAQELSAHRQDVDYRQILGDSRILFLGEDHSNHSIRSHVQRHAAQLREAGITHYAIEADEAGNEVFEGLNHGENVDLTSVDVGPGQEDYRAAILAMASQGIKIVAVDIDQSNRPSKEQREARLTENISRIVDSNPEAKVAILIGGFHAHRGRTSGFPYVAVRLEDAGHPTRVVYFAGGEDNTPTSVTDAANQAGLAQTEFMLNMEPYVGEKYVPFGSGMCDYLIHLPQNFSSSFSLGVINR